MLKIQSRLPKLWFMLNGIKYGKKVKLYGYPFVFRFPKAKIEIGNNVKINSSFLSNLLGLYQRTIIVARGEGKVRIGENVGISGSTIYAREEIVIGANTLIGANTKIIDNDFHPLDVEMRNHNDFSKLPTKAVQIGNDVFIGCNCIILKGTQIGDRSVVGAGAVVKGSFPSDCVIAGNPAVIVRRAEK